MTFPNRKAEVVDLMGSDRRVVTIRFIPADQTRTALATIDPRARLGVISTFPEFLPIMKAGVQQFAPHVRRLEATVLQSPDLKEVLRRVDAVVYASGSERDSPDDQAGRAGVRISPRPRSARDRRSAVAGARGTARRHAAEKGLGGGMNRET